MPASTARRSGRRSRHQPRTYAAVSTLLREDFARPPALRRRQIDLLHIDGLHSFEAVSADFEPWAAEAVAPRRRAAARHPGARARLRGLAAGRGAAAPLPLFDFAHGHGLAVVGFGPDLPPALRALLAAEADPAAKAAIERSSPGSAGPVSSWAAARRPPLAEPQLARARRAIRDLTAGEPPAVAAIAGSRSSTPPGTRRRCRASPARESTRPGTMRSSARSSASTPAGLRRRLVPRHHPDVAAAGVNPLAHYLLHGRGEGRATRPAPSRITCMP